MRRPALAAALILLCACPKKKDEGGAPEKPAAAVKKVGLVVDIGGRGDQSFNDSALRGLELWAAGKAFTGGRYRPATPDEVKATLPEELQGKVTPVAVEPLVLQSKSKEDYEPNLQLLVDEGAGLAIGVGYLLEPAIEIVAKRNPDSKFLLIDNQLQDKGKPYTLPNVRAVTFKEEEGSFLVGALAGLVSPSGKMGFVGGAEVELIQKFEAGFRAGVKATRPEATVLVNYTGSFDNVAVGKQVAQDLLSKGVDVVFHAAGTDGLGVIQAVKEARSGGKSVWAIGVDSDQSAVAPEAVMTSMLKRVDLAVYETTRDYAAGKFTGGNQVLGLKEGGVGYAPVRIEVPHKAEALAKVEALKAKIVAGQLQVPARPSEVASFRVSP